MLDPRDNFLLDKVNYLEDRAQFVFGNGLDFFVWLRFLRDGLRIEFFQGIESFFMGIEIYFSGSGT